MAQAKLVIINYYVNNNNNNNNIKTPQVVNKIHLDENKRISKKSNKLKRGANEMDDSDEDLEDIQR